MRLLQSLLFGCGVLAVLAPEGGAHFRLMEPASWLEESSIGDPQKKAPCGGTSADPGKPTGAVTNVAGGEKLHIKLRETVFHPGFYRVALAVNSRDELPPDPEVKTEAGANGPRSVSAAIHYPPAPPILADGLFPHTAKFDKELETDVDIPNINCAKCTLQIVEFMASHGLNKDGDYSYHHCAVLQIRANPDKPIDSRFPAEKK
ncbi:MAG: SCE4755 family polysaccharide monooxygenase-like protein [Bryobacteraceae bacterium]